MTAFQDKPRGDCTGERSRPTLRLSTLEAVMSVAFSYGRRGRTAAIRRGPRAARMPLFSFGETIVCVCHLADRQRHRLGDSNPYIAALAAISDGGTHWAA
jgi:hypothetical protein